MNSDDVVLALANENIPIAVISRATGVPSSALYEQLRDAREQGLLETLPPPDWPPGCPRDQRATQLARMGVEDKGKLLLAVGQAFGLSRQPAQLLLKLLQGSELSCHDTMNAKRTHVHVCRVRKHLRPFGIVILTVWGEGYRLSAEDRHRAMELISRQGSG